jgi:hypothetical protein
VGAGGVDHPLCVGGDPGEKPVVEVEVVPTDLENVGDPPLGEAPRVWRAVEQVGQR